MQTNFNYYLNSNIYGYNESIIILNIDENNITNSNKYEIYSSSLATNATTINKAILFNYDNQHIIYNSLWNYKNYNSNGIFNSNIDTFPIINNNPILNFFNYNGDYIIIKLHTNLILNKFRFYALENSLIYAPGNWKCIYSNDGNNWYELIDASLNTESVRIRTMDYNIDIYNNYYYEKKLLNNNITCLYIGFIFQKLAKQVYDLALLSQNMLTGADLTAFIQRTALAL